MSNKPEPKFVPGEMVILESKNMPECNGIRRVVDVKFFHRAHDMQTKEPMLNAFAYVLAEVDAGCAGWAEESLSKLPPNTPTTFADCIFKPEKVTA